MKQADILEVFIDATLERIHEEWKHQVFIGGWSSNYINFEIDGTEYVLLIREIQDGEHFSDFMIVNRGDIQ